MQHRVDTSQLTGHCLHCGRASGARPDNIHCLDRHVRLEGPADLSQRMPERMVGRSSGGPLHRRSRRARPVGDHSGLDVRPTSVLTWAPSTGGQAVNINLRAHGCHDIDARQPGRKALPADALRWRPMAYLGVDEYASADHGLAEAGGVALGAKAHAGRDGMRPTSVEGAPQCAPAAGDDHEIGLASTLDRAVSMLLVHVAGVDGHCVGCADRCCFALAPCPVSRWARSVVETHGVAVWDARPTGCAESLSLTPLDAGEAPSLSRVAV